MLNINISDVINVVNNIRGYLIVLGVCLFVAIAVTIAVRKKSVPQKRFVRVSSWLAFVLAAAIIVNMICFGPMYNLIALALDKGVIADETATEANELCEQIADEGIVLLKNDGLLPLSDGEKLNVFGWASMNPIYGGTGSGSISDAYEKVSILDGLTNAGFELNDELSSFYTSFREDRPAVEMFEQDWTLPEPTVDAYEDELLENAKSFSDKAIIVISRPGGEGADLPKRMGDVTYENNSDDYDDFADDDHYLQLSATERKMIEMVCGQFDDVVIVYNGANTLELGFVDEYPQIKAAIWCPGAGQTGFNALGKILDGEINPSAKTSDIFLKDLTASPSFNNVGKFEYDNMDEYPADEWGDPSVATFVNYVEGIYVGYRFFETADVEGKINYDEVVQYPFGYGLSYTDFKQKMGEVKVENGTVSFSVTVKNKGDVAGKDVVEVYDNPPYENGGIEKAAANLVAFEKTDLLEPGESQTVDITFDLEDLASYDRSGDGAYVLEAGDYEFSIRSDSHHSLDMKTYTVDETIIYDASNKRSSDAEVADNKFDAMRGEVTYLSRADGFANYDEATAAPTDFSMLEKYKETFINNSNYDVEADNNDADEMPMTGAKNGLKLKELRGVDYDDAQWDTLLDELTVDEMAGMVAIGGFQTSAASSVGKVQTVDCDGPASINNNFTGIGSIGFPSETMVACTWNKEIAKEFGRGIGKMADEMKVSGWYAPAMNTHRSAFAGRNFEYYSEDGVLAGKMAANAVQGAAEYGVYAYLKHFALNDQEGNRNRMICTWADEQAVREIYLRPFEIAVKEGDAHAIMSSFNYLGTRYAGACSELLNDVLRGEWGFRGMVLTDYFGVYGYQNADQEIRNGNDLMLVAYDAGTNYPTDTTSATAVKAMRTACHNIMYTVVNSRAYDPDKMQTGLRPWQWVFIIVDLLIAALVLGLGVRSWRKYRGEMGEY